MTAKWFIAFTCGNYSTPTITALKLKYSVTGWIHYPHEWVRELHIYESRLVVAAGVIVLSWHRIEEKKQARTFTMVKLRHRQCKCMGITHSFSKELMGFTSKLHLRKYWSRGSQGTCCIQDLLSQTDIKLKNKARVYQKWKYNFIIVPYLLYFIVYKPI